MTTPVGNCPICHGSLANHEWLKACAAATPTEGARPTEIDYKLSLTRLVADVLRLYKEYKFPLPESVVFMEPSKAEAASAAVPQPREMRCAACHVEIARVAKWYHINGVLDKDHDPRPDFAAAPPAAPPRPSLGGNMNHTAFADKMNNGDWRVEAFGSEGECFVTIFCGPNNEHRAKEYAAWMNQK